MDSILLIDDEETYCKRFAEILRRQAKLQVDWVVTEDKIPAALARKTYGAILLDLVFDDEIRGFDILQKLRRDADCPPVIILTNTSEVPRAVRAIKMGAVDYLEKSSDLDRIILTIKIALKSFAMTRENRELRRVIRGKYRIIGDHPETMQLMDKVRRIASSDALVLVTGETGTGKELVARALHAESDRIAEPFVPVNCAAIPETLIESELFGHEKGSFSGAHQRREGAFISAGRGVLFLDEVGDLSPMAQAKLLRALEEHVVQRVGSHEEIPYCARVIAATRWDLTAMVHRGDFREDLYHRLDVIKLQVPPLRERRDDVRALFDYYLNLSCVEAGGAVPSVSGDVYRMLRAYQWPGNIRELKHLAQKIALLHAEDRLSVSDVLCHLPELTAVEDSHPKLKVVRDTAEREYLEKVLSECQGNVAEAASRMGESVWNIYKKLDKYPELRDRGVAG